MEKWKYTCRPNSISSISKKEKIKKYICAEPTYRQRTLEICGIFTLQGSRRRIQRNIVLLFDPWETPNSPDRSLYRCDVVYRTYMHRIFYCCWSSHWFTHLWHKQILSFIQSTWVVLLSLIIYFILQNNSYLRTKSSMLNFLYTCKINFRPWCRSKNASEWKKINVIS